MAAEASPSKHSHAFHNGKLAVCSLRIPSESERWHQAGGNFSPCTGNGWKLECGKGLRVGGNDKPLVPVLLISNYKVRTISHCTLDVFSYLEQHSSLLSTEAQPPVGGSTGGSVQLVPGLV